MKKTLLVGTLLVLGFLTHDMSHWFNHSSWWPVAVGVPAGLGWLCLSELMEIKNERH